MRERIYEIIVGRGVGSGMWKIGILIFCIMSKVNG